MEITKKLEERSFQEIHDIIPYFGGFLTCSGMGSMKFWIDDKDPAILNADGFGGVRCMVEWEGKLAWGCGTDIHLMSFDSMTLDTLKGHVDTVVSLCTWKEYLCSSSADFTIRLWSKTAKCDFCLYGHTDMVFQMIVFKDHLFSVGDSRVIPWKFEAKDNETKNEVPIQKGHILGHRNTIFCICEWNGKIATGSRDKKIGIWNGNGSFEKFLKGHNDGIKKLVSFEYRLISGATDGTICVWNENFKMIQSIWLGWDGISAMCVVDRRVIVGCSDGTLVEMKGSLLENLISNQQPKNLGVPSDYYGLQQRRKIANAFYQPSPLI